ncbi:protoheme IX farnesyltransferase, mitochondrial [Schistocerca americana]|uniref:protoheme IX farnesyltransferase, mitochondrial n=1 Tax=Schistocerca americana TaxID=7009 RepID=UPI001F4FC4B0|nr:protoheme IX farnesyltransferase, mitochondrial [Schistocerca americana]
MTELYEQQLAAMRLKYAIVRSLLKKGDRKDIKKYQPISLLTSFSEIFEKYSSKVSSGRTTTPVVAQPRESLSLKNEFTLLERELLPKATSLSSPSSDTSTSSTSTKKKNVADSNKWQEITINYSTLPQQYLKLSKIRLTSLVVMSSMAGYALAPAPFELSTFILSSVGTGLTSCAANSINQFFEVPFDSQMARTRNRVLVRGTLTPLHAISFAAVCAVTGLSTLYWGTNALTASLGAANLVLYTMIYTPLKRISILNTWVGGVVGAIPPLMGWASCMDSLGAGAWIMAGILYAWQFPHFNALSWNLRPDYSRAGYRMMSVTDPDLCRKTSLRYTGGILILSCLAPVMDITNWYFALESIPLNGYFLYLAWKFYKESDTKTSRKLFRFSLIHLPALMLLMLINKKTWATSESKSDELAETPLVEVTNEERTNT